VALPVSTDQQQFVDGNHPDISGGGSSVRVNNHTRSGVFPCTGVRHGWYLTPKIEVNPAEVSILLISNTAPADSSDRYYAAGLLSH